MYGIIFDSLDRFYSQALAGLQIYTDTLRKDTEEKVNRALQYSSPQPREKAEVIAFGGKSVHTPHFGEHDTIYYDFPHHHITSQSTWQNVGSTEFLKHAKGIGDEIVRESKQIQRAFMRYHSRYFGYIDTYLNQLNNPLFQYQHYRQFHEKHIGVQRKEDNVIYAFSFSPEETNIYTTIDKMHLQWEKEKSLLIQGFTRLIGSIDHLGTVHERVRLFGPEDGTDITQLEGQRMGTREEVARFIELLSHFHIEEYLTYNKKYLSTIHAGIKQNLSKKKQNNQSV